MSKFIGLTDNGWIHTKTRYIDLESISAVDTERMFVYIKGMEKSNECFKIYQKKDMEEIMEYVKENMWTKREHNLSNL